MSLQLSSVKFMLHVCQAHLLHCTTAATTVPAPPLVVKSTGLHTSSAPQHTHHTYGYNRQQHIHALNTQASVANSTQGIPPLRDLATAKPAQAQLYTIPCHMQALDMYTPWLSLIVLLQL